MENNDRAAIIGKGDVRLETANGTKLVLKSVRHVEALRLNIFLFGLLDEDGYLIWRLTVQAHQRQHGSSKR